MSYGDCDLSHGDCEAACGDGDGDGVVNVSHGDCGDDHAACGDGVVVILSNQRRPWTPPVIWRHPRI